MRESKDRRHIDRERQKTQGRIEKTQRQKREGIRRQTDTQTKSYRQTKGNDVRDAKDVIKREKEREKLLRLEKGR